MAKLLRSPEVLPPLTLDWRSGEFSDWECQLADRSFKLHRHVLAGGSRASGFFQAAFREEYKASSTDLSELLPSGCQEYFPVALDFLYGHEIELTQENCIALCKIADVLQIEPLLNYVLAAINNSPTEIGIESLVFALELEMPSSGIEAIVRAMPVKDVLLALAQKRDVPDMKSVLLLCAERLLCMSNSASLLVPDIPFLSKSMANGVVDLVFTRRQTVRFEVVSRLDVAVSRVQVMRLTGSGPTIGVSRMAADLTFADCP
ncbi:unnamed protein product, partial [Polarella glacialis]